ncbi:class I SAM-dependent methyltransferase [Microvirga lotononidis]|uniref:Methylase involved in ubiquinone/menaquinone biosynthesis n=1 Tax=Microvirga lotononidis TaxID=864069 RepID=I4YMM1_9HYPH|nr:class I SAM-dependent methyltransferase [Microvirga lotononidis]EIM25213.1 methylase involved in ubiquinone/menaquinone biosynthesis [Microvirga lotononidis]WQO29300.1 class I SAM-dependent methyltransferase [Microvirga lotononidis]
MSSKFHAKSADAYERLMGRWSRRLARPFLDFAGLEAGERVLDVGCGTGSLTFTLPQVANVARIDAIDYSDVYVEASRARNTDPRITIAQGDVCELPFEDRTFDRALALLVLHFVPESEQALREMSRVTKAGGVVAAAVWDSFGGMPVQRMFWDTAAALDPSAAKIRGENYFKPLTRRGEMETLWKKTGLRDVTETELAIRMDFDTFEDFWRPIANGESPLGKYVTGLDGGRLAAFERALRAAYEAGEPDGPRSFTATALACRGIVPDGRHRQEGRP